MRPRKEHMYFVMLSLEGIFGDCMLRWVGVHWLSLQTWETVPEKGLPQLCHYRTHPAPVCCFLLLFISGEVGGLITVVFFFLMARLISFFFLFFFEVLTKIYSALLCARYCFKPVKQIISILTVLGDKCYYCFSFLQMRTQRREVR